LAGVYPSSDVQVDEIAGFCIDQFVDLTLYKELPQYDLDESYMKYKKFQMTDYDIPTKEEMREIIDYLLESVQNGNSTYVHCWDGVGRTGVVIGCLLVELGFTPNQAISLMANFRQGMPRGSVPSPGTPEQAAFIHNWK